MGLPQACPRSGIGSEQTLNAGPLGAPCRAWSQRCPVWSSGLRTAGRCRESRGPFKRTCWWICVSVGISREAGSLRPSGEWQQLPRSLEGLWRAGQALYHGCIAKGVVAFPRRAGHPPPGLDGTQRALLFVF